MNLFIVGATGRTGRHVISQGISRGHRLTAVVRKPQALNPHANLQIVLGNPSRIQDLAKVLPGQDAVISCLGQKSRADAGLLQHAAAAMLDAMARTGVRRYLLVSQGLLFPSRNPIVAILRIILARHIADSRAMERLVRASATDWTIVRPPRLLDGESPRGYRTTVGVQPAGAWAMQRADLATFLLDETEKHEHSRAIVGVTSG